MHRVLKNKGYGRMGNSLQEKIIEQVKQSPDKIAVIFKGNQFTYKDLDEASNKIALKISTIVTEKNSVVGIGMPRGFDQICAILGVLKAGHYYLPLDLEYPPERLVYMLKKANAYAVIGDGESFSSEIEHINFMQAIDSNEGELLVKNDNGYVIYTSGSTGKPKGISMGQKSLLNLLSWQSTQIDKGRTLQFAPISFDVHFQEIFGTLIHGETLVLTTEEARKDFTKLLGLLDECRVENMFLPFVALDQLAKLACNSKQWPKYLKNVAVAGEQLRINENIKTFFNNTGAKLFNHYGPSETHVCFSKTLDGEPADWVALPTIGRPISNVDFLIMDKSGKEAPEGELFVGGDCLADFYINDLKTTNERFVFLNDQRYYRTGDHVRVNRDRELQFLGRLDDQVKIAGHRVELGELERIAQEVFINNEVCVGTPVLTSGEATLVVYVKGNLQNKVSLMASLKSRLPNYMHPRAVVELEEFPKTPSGKLDRKSLRCPSLRRGDLGNEYVAPRSELEQKIANAWKRVLLLDEVGIDDKFFDLGGTSLLAMDLVEELKVIFPEISTVQLFEATTIRELAKLRSNVNGRLKDQKRQGVKNRDIAIIGMCGRFPGAGSVDELWELLKNNSCGITRFDLKDTCSSVSSIVKKSPSFVAAEGVIQDRKEFDGSFFGMTPRECELMDPQQRKMLELCWEALEIAGINPKTYQGKVGVFAGAGNNTYSKNLDAYSEKVREFGEFNVMLANEKDYIATRPAYKIGLKGPAISIYTGCSTSLVAIVQAVEALRNGICDVAIAGGISIHGQDKQGYIHQEGSIFSKDGFCRPYSDNASGTIFTEGAGLVVLRRKDFALENNNTIYALIKGVGLNNDGADKMSFTAPSINGQTEAITSAILDSGVNPNDIAYVEGHGTATPIGDPIEVAALSKAFRQFGHDNKCYLGSIKSNLGHLTAAAGVVGLIKGCLGLRNGLMPATIGIDVPNKNIEFEKVNFVPAKENVAIAKDALVGISSFGVGGTNAHVIIQGFIGQKDKHGDRDEIFILSAKNEESLNEMKKVLDQKAGKINFSTNEAFSLSKRATFNLRTFRTKNGKWASTIKNQAEKLVFMFPGQGSQYVGMGKQLYEKFPQFRKHFESCCSIVSQEFSEDFLGIMLGDNADVKILNNTYYTQPAILTFEYCLSKLLESFNVTPDGYIGHSIGELSACVCSGVISIEAALKIVCKRSSLMSNLERGAMMSAMAQVEELESLLPKTIQVAAINSRRSVVIAGPIACLEEMSKTLKTKNWAHKILLTSHAFHSKMMEPIISEFKSYIGGFEFKSPKRPFVSTVTGDLESENFCSKDYWAEHVARTVLFSPALEKILDEKSIYLEVGPRTVLKQLGNSVAKDKGFNCEFISVSGVVPDESEYTYFLNCLGSLWQLGIDVDFEPLYRNEDVRFVPAVTYQFKKTVHWLENQKTDNNTNLDIRGVKMKNDRNDEFIKIVGQVVEDASGIDLCDYSEDTCFFEMGMDSLFLTQIVQKINQKFKVNLGFRQLAEEFNTIEALSMHLQDSVVLSEHVPAATTEMALNVQNTSLSIDDKEIIDMSPASDIDNLIHEQLNIMKLQLELVGSKKKASNTKSKTEKQTPLEPTAAKAAKDRNKAFGAMAKINSDTSETNLSELEFYRKFVKEYNTKTRRSKSFAQDNRIVHADPRVVTGFRPESKEIVYPIVSKSSMEQKIIDIDGNEYVDMLCGFGSNFFGNNNKRINEALTEQISQGMEIGPQHPLVSEVSNLISELTGNERSAFCNTGSEAVLGAMRIARTITGKDKVICFNGSYHGIIDEVIVRSSHKGKSLPAAPGIPSSAVEKIIVLNYGEEESLNEIEELCSSGEVAAVLVEPVQSRRCDLQPKQFLKKLREITQKENVCLIFDEVITGFRIHTGGAQSFFGIKADLCTYGKIIGGGMPIGVLSGKARYMDALDGGHWEYGDGSVPTVGVTYFAGTFVRHPLALRAAKEALTILKEVGVQGLELLNQRTQDFVDELNCYLENCQSNLRFINFGSLLKPKWIENDYMHSDLFFAMLRNEGVHQYDGFPWFINLAHSENDLEFVKKTIMSVVHQLQENELMPGAPLEKDGGMPKGARLGKDLNGNPGWFLPHPEKHGQYLQIR